MKEFVKKIIKFARKDVLVPLLVITRTSSKVQEHRQFLTSRYLLLSIFVLLLLLFFSSSCKSYHSFSINAEEIVNPSIQYTDSTNLYNPFKK